MIPCFFKDIRDLRDLWEATSFELEALQAAKACVEAERASLHSRVSPAYRLSFPFPTSHPGLGAVSLSATAPIMLPEVAIIRQEGSNGDREMASAFIAAGFSVWDITMRYARVVLTSD